MDDDSQNNDIGGICDPLVKVTCDLVIGQAIRDKAQWICIDPLERDVRIRYPINGVMTDVMALSKSDARPLIAHFKELSSLNLSERRVPKDERIPVHHDGVEYDLHGICEATEFGVRVLLRLNRTSMFLPTLDNHGFDLISLAALKQAAAASGGMILVTGPRESGRTTLLYSVINDRNQPQVNVLTIEDPVEFDLPGIAQVHIQAKAGMTFAAALRAFLRGDPDVIMLSDIPDLETARIAMEAATTDHLLLAGMQTASAPTALLRLREMGIEADRIAASVSVVVGIRLVRRLCDYCKTAMDPGDAAEAMRRVRDMPTIIKYEVPEAPILFDATGCPACGESGFQGRIALHEVLTCNPELVNGILESDDREEMTRVAVSNDMRTLLADGLARAVGGETTIDEVIAVTTEED